MLYDAAGYVGAGADGSGLYTVSVKNIETKIQKKLRKNQKNLRQKVKKIETYKKKF